MSKILNTATAIIVIGLAATGVAQAAPLRRLCRAGPGVWRGAAAPNAAVQQSGSTSQHPAAR
jgi:hypothetical protein